MKMNSIVSSLLSEASSSLADLADLADLILVTTIPNKLSTRNAIVRRVIRHVGHQFEATLLAEPTKCSLCNKMIWLPHGQRCKLCKLISHVRCVSRIYVSCGKGEHGGKDHQLKLLKSVLTPTMCDHCGTYIIALCKYYHCSSCSRNYHKGCVDDHYISSQECRSRSIENYNVGARFISTFFPQKSKRGCPDKPRTHIITIDQFELVGLLGRGSFSAVYLARRKMDGKDRRKMEDKGRLFAIKVIKKTEPTVSADPQSVFNEWQGLRLGCSYPFLAIAHCCFQTPDRLFFVMDCVQGRDLLYHVEHWAPFPEDRVRFHSAEIVLALIYMHNRSIVYRDLKLNNVILGIDGHCKLIDFGMSKELKPQTNKRTNTFCGTLLYLSPEILNGDPYDWSVDWWCLGIMMYEMLCNRVPFNGQDDEEIFDAISLKPLAFPNDPPIKLSVYAKSILNGLLTKEPERRLGCDSIGAEAIKRHKFFWNDGYGNYIDIEEWWREIENMKIEPPYVSRNLKESDDNKILLDLSRTNLTPIDRKQMGEIQQSDFDNFSQYSESFLQSI